MITLAATDCTGTALPLLWTSSSFKQSKCYTNCGSTGQVCPNDGIRGNVCPTTLCCSEAAESAQAVSMTVPRHMVTVGKETAQGLLEMGMDDAVAARNHMEMATGTEAVYKKGRTMHPSKL